MKKHINSTLQKFFLDIKCIYRSHNKTINQKGSNFDFIHLQRLVALIFLVYFDTKIKLKCISDIS